MATSLQLAAILLALPVAAAPVKAQVEVAPPPRSVLDEVAREYVELGLPLPPKDAVPVRIDELLFSEEDGTPRFKLAFRTIDPARPNHPVYRVLDWKWPHLRTLEAVHPKAVEVLKPDPESASAIIDPNGDLLLYAVYFKLRVEHAFADALYFKGMANNEIDRERISELLRERAWELQEKRLLEQKSDRAAAWKALTRLMDRYSDFQTPENKQFLASLELSVRFVRTAKPGSAESLIDDLMDHCWGEPDSRRAGEGWAAYWKLTDMGFDAIPALIDHLQDNRLSRSRHVRNGDGPDTHWYTVGHLCCEILRNLSDYAIEGDFTKDSNTRYTAAEVRKWFEKAKKVGEERWLADKAVFEGCFSEYDSPRVIRRVLGVKYPDRLPAVMRGPKQDCYRYGPIAPSGLPAKTKVAMLKEGANEFDEDRWESAMFGLADLDRVEHRRALLATLRKMERDEKCLHHGFAGGHEFLRQLLIANDADCWKAFTSTFQRVKGDREHVIRIMGDTPGPWAWKGTYRAERLRFQMAFLNDPEFGDLAATNIAALCGYRVRRNDWGDVYPDDDSGPLCRLLYRAQMAAAAGREIERLGKP